MGTWNNKIDGNDTFQDIYQNFFDLYNQGQDPVAVSKEIQELFAEMFNDYDDRNDSLFGLALAQWETKSLDLEVYRQVKEIVETGSDLKVWKGLGANEKTLKERQIILNKFLSQISTVREKPKRRVRRKFEFEKISLVDAVAPDKLKKFEVNEEYVNKQYVHTSGLMMWEEGGGSVLYFTGQGKSIAAHWLDSNTLEVTYDKDIVFTKQNDTAFFCGDEIKVIYKPQ
jgi:hypothetical protein